MDVRSNYSFVRNFTPKPMPTIEVSAVLCCEAFFVLRCAVRVWLVRRLKLSCVLHCGVVLGPVPMR
jgi:hypothetical protein